MARKKAPVTDKADDSFSQIRDHLIKQAEIIIELRNKEREFHGLEREFSFHFAQMIVDWEKSSNIRHPRDVGNARENILAKFFNDNELLPAKYAVTTVSTRCCSTDGFLSRELDLLFYARDENVKLMHRNDAYDVFPIESSLGGIQVKSRLNKAELKDAFINIASLRRLRKLGRDHRAFGIIFAFDTDLEWKDLIAEVKKNSENLDNQEIPNAIFILTKGHFIFGSEKFGSIHSAHVPAASESRVVYGTPNQQNQVLYTLYSIALALLREAPILQVPIDKYFSLPPTVGDISYQFCLGHFAELGNCTEHGPYARRIAEKPLRKVLAFCRASKPVSYAHAISEAFQRIESTANFWGMPSEVFIYNPDGLPNKDILSIDREFLDGDKTVTAPAIAFDFISCEGMIILIPYYYSLKEKIIDDCLSCIKKEKRRQAAEAKRLREQSK
ncbi:hypothetical protein D9M68_283470 [compost metagenome]